MFSARSAAPREANALHAEVEALRQAGAAYLDLTPSNPTQVGLPWDAEAIGSALAAAARTRYEPLPFGMLRARAAICAHYRAAGITVPAERIVLSASTSESYSFLFTLLCDAGDDVLVPAPSYPLFEYLARFAGVNPVQYRLRHDGAWHIDFASLKRALTPRTRAVVVVNPNNPTGSYISADEWQQLAQLGLPLISDEVFARYPLRNLSGPTSLLGALEQPVQPVFALDGLSKYAGMPQLKLGTIAFRAPSTLEDELVHRLELIADTYLSVSTPVQAALPALLQLAKPMHAAISVRAQHNLRQLEQGLAGGPVSLLPPEGGWCAVLRLPQVMGEQEWVLRLLRERRVLVQPGWFYDFAEEPFVVLSLLTPEATFARGIEQIRAAVAALL